MEHMYSNKPDFYDLNHELTVYEEEQPIGYCYWSSKPIFEGDVYRYDAETEQYVCEECFAMEDEFLKTC